MPKNISIGNKNNQLNTVFNYYYIKNSDLIVELKVGKKIIINNYER